MGVSRGGKIITEDLIFCIDAASKRSYSSGTGWSDLVLGNDGLLLNGAAFSSDIGGCINFDGTDERVNFATSESVGTSDFTLEILWRRNIEETGRNMGVYVGHPYAVKSLSGFVLWSGAGGGVTLYCYPGDGSSQGVTSPTGHSSIFTIDFLNNWTHTIVTVKRSTSSGSDNLWYINGIKYTNRITNVPKVDPSWDLAYENGYPKLGDWPFGDLNGQIALVRIYKKHFSEEEALQNYNSTRGRFE